LFAIKMVADGGVAFEANDGAQVTGTVITLCPL
jgi:hypothetical protein